jgi:glycosyltransferase involved in cell wall biosynthesis
VRLSVIVVTHNAARTIVEVMTALRRSDLPRESYEILVVDDGSTDESVAFAARYADTVIRLTGRRNGPAYARNRGVEFARGEILTFVGDDVVVQPDTLSKLLAVLTARPDVAAVSASQDQSGGPSNFVSRYWNSLVQLGEQRHADRCIQFAARCGAVRRSVFIRTGMYDEWRFATDCVEGADLAERLRAAGHGVVLASDATVVHLRQWRLDEVFREVWSRGRLVARCLGYTRMSTALPGEVVFTLSRSFTPAIALLTTLTLAAAFVPAPRTSAKIVFALGALMLTNLPMHRFYWRARGVGFAILSAPLHVCVQIVAGAGLCVGWILRDLFGDISPDATTQAYSEVGLEVWPPVRRRV